jgi:multiple sugar transport system substrate-binding protein
VANSTLTQLMNDGLVRPLNDLIEKYGENIPDNLLITIGGNVMAVAFMANSQHLFARPTSSNRRASRIPDHL